jgi:hypothetical protein
VTGTLGAGLGPVFIAAVAEYFFGGGAAIGRGIAALIVICFPLAALLLALGLRAMREAAVSGEHV